MLGWLKEKAASSFLKSDTEKSIRGLVNLPAAVQKQCAKKIMHEIFTALAELEQSPKISTDRDATIRKQLDRAKANRHLAVMNGARDHTNPEWAVAALCESWLMANTGSLGRGTFDTINGLILAWVHTTLSDAEFKAIARSFTNSK